MLLQGPMRGSKTSSMEARSTTCKQQSYGETVLLLPSLGRFVV